MIDYYCSFQHDTIMTKHIFRHTLALLLMLPFAALALQAASKSGSNKQILAFGYSTCLNDSIVYLTPIMEIPGASLDSKTKFLNKRQDYTNQLKTFMESKYEAHQTSVIVFSTSRKKLEDKYIKMRRSLQKKHLHKVVELETGSFQFAAIPSKED